MAMTLRIEETNHVSVLQSINRGGMEPKLYRGAVDGSLDVIHHFNWIDCVTPNGNNVLHVHVGEPLQSCKSTAKANMKIEFIQAILNHEAGYPLLWQRNASGDIPLHLAAKFGNTKAAEEFLKRAGAVDQGEAMRMLEMMNKKKDTALHEAVRGGHADVVALLVKLGVHSVQQPNNMGETLLYLAAEKGCDQLVDHIVDICRPSNLDIKHQGPCGRTALHAAIQWGTPEMVRKMMEMSRSLVRIQDNEGRTPLHCAAGDIDKLDLLQVLLDHDDENESATYLQDYYGCTALHIAILQCNWSAVKKLKDFRPDCVEIVDNKGQNVVHYAAKFGCLNKFEAFLRLGHFGRLINEKDEDGNTPLHLLSSIVPNTTPHYCLRRLRRSISLHQLDAKAFNDQNLTAGDIMASNDILRKHVLVGMKMRDIAPRGWRNYEYERHTKVDKANDDKLENTARSYKEAAQYHLVVATLIVTVSFTAAFTLPGGFDQNSCSTFGMAILSRNAAFKVFLISDALAFTCSIIAVISYFVLAYKRSLFFIERFELTGKVLTIVSLGPLFLALVTGVYAVVNQSHDLTFAVLGLCACFLFHYVALLRGCYQMVGHYLNRCVIR